MALRYSARGALCFGCSRLASSVAAARISRLLRPQQAALQVCGRKNLQIVAADLGVGIFAGDDLALLGDPDLAVHRAAGLRDDRLIARPAAAADRAAAAVEQPQAHVVAFEHLD